MTQTIFEPEATPLATRPARELAPAPVNLQTMAGLLTIAVEKGLSPEAMERLVNLQQRLMQQQAEEAFNLAIQRFQSACPVITKNATADAGKYSYNFADLPHIAATIRPHLESAGLSYSFDSKLESDRLRVTCTVHHVAGHSRTSTFEAKIDGPSAMSQLHKSASTLTYCRRYALTLALGLTTADTDDDGRGITTPSPQPGPDPNSPRVAPRNERQERQPADAGPPRVTAETLNRLLMKWKDKVSKQGTPAGFADWCSEKLTSDADLLKPSNWKIEMVEAIEELLR
jgi:hypothetical protein